MMFLRRDLVEGDLDRFSKSIASDYNVDSCVVFKREEKEKNEYGDFLSIGYAIEKENNTYFVTMPYVENEIGELAVARKSFDIELNGQKIYKELPSLREVFDALNIQKVR